MYKTGIEPRTEDEDTRRHEFIFNITISTLLCTVCVLYLSLVYTTATGVHGLSFNLTPFLFFILFFVGLLTLSRKGKIKMASYLFIGIYFVATTYGIYTWGTEVPLALLSYSLIIIITSILISTRCGFIITILTICSIVLIGYLHTKGFMSPDIAWHTNFPLFKDIIEDSFVYIAIIVIFWLSNRDLEKSLRRARRSEQTLIEERNLLEIRVDERTKDLKAAQLEKVSQLYKFVEFGRLSSGIFHDIINPLTTMSLTVEQLQNETVLKSPKYVELIERALRASKRIESFVQTARKKLDTEGVEEIFCIEKEIRDAIDLLLHKSRTKGIEIRADIYKTTLIYGDSVKFFQIVVNLMSNAIDSYTSDTIAHQKEIVISISSTVSHVQLKVRDYGCGIEATLHKTIFDPFFTTKSKQTGMGLGLSTTKDIIEKDFNGQISLESTVGEGSLFTVHLPIERKLKKVEYIILPNNTR